MTTVAPTTITLVRHGHVYNPENIIYGRLPGYRLSQSGRRQAEAAAGYLANASLGAIFSSPQLRATETAGILQLRHRELTVLISPQVDEIRCFFEGHPAEEVEARGWDLYTGVGEGYEVPVEIADRGTRLIHQIRETHPGRQVAVVTHGDIIAFTVLHAMRQAVHVSQKRTLGRYGITDLYPATASLTTLVYGTEDPDEIPQLEYVRPYHDDLALASLS